MVRALLGLSFSVVALCSVVSAGPAAQGLTAFTGRPTVRDDANACYFVWRDGNTWHVRWTTWEHNQVFRGTVSATGGTLQEFKRIDVDAELKVIRAGRTDPILRRPQSRVLPGYWPVAAAHPEDHITKINDQIVRWSTRSNEEIDGFSFQADGVGALIFDLRLLNPFPTRAGREVETRPRSVDVGQNNVHPDSNPFTVAMK